MTDDEQADDRPLDDLVLDERGLRCPMPVIDLGRRIADVDVGGVVRALCDDPAAATDIPAWCEMRGHELVGIEDLGAVQVYRVRRTS